MTARPAAIAPLLASLVAAAALLARPSLAPGQPRLARPTTPTTPASSSAPASSGAPAPSSAGLAAGAPPRLAGFAPDPDPLVTRRKWIYQIIWHEGAVFVPTPRLIERKRPTETPRVMGRFALELYVGRTLVERVRFELPNLDGDVLSGQRRPRGAGLDMERRVRVTASVEVPDSDRATYAVLVDRATGVRQRVPWVPVDRLSATSPAASAPGTAASAPTPSSPGPPGLKASPAPAGTTSSRPPDARPPAPR
jgi:hypothetical protein